MGDPRMVSSLRSTQICGLVCWCIVNYIDDVGVYKETK